MITISRTYDFEAAHRLPNVPDGHKCGRMHGHHYELTVEVSGNIDVGTGWFADFANIDAVVKPVVASLDHTYLNDAVPNPTAENLVIHLVARIMSPIHALGVGVELRSLELSETPRSKARWTAPQRKLPVVR